MSQIQLSSTAKLQPILQKELGKCIREARKRRNLSQAALAYFSGIHPSHISKIERGQANMTLSSLLAIAIALKINPFGPLQSISLSALEKDLLQAESDSEPGSQEPSPRLKEARHGA